MIITEKLFQIFKILLLILLFLYSNKIIILNVQIFEKPLISIIIPVHNQFKYTYHCVSSILNDNSILPYEIIIADDLSTDNTKIIESYIKNIIIIHNDKKYNFLLNCNRASRFASGKYIIFLNNDTKVNKEWLISLFNLIESDEKIGMVGSKLIYPNGLLQEAGGIVFNDGSCSNFGRGCNPDLPEYNYVKEVDYISGASIIVRKSLWDNIGGFDERFSPAYYEDTDLAFELRKLGYKVVYQPKSVVIHFEGISNGKNIKLGIKQFQEVNKYKFYKKWQQELVNQENRNNTFIARDRSYNKNRILVIDKYVPNFEKSAGERCTFIYMNLMKELGLQVTLIGNDFQKNEPYSSILQQKGIEVIYGNVYQNNIENWLKNNLKYFQYVYLQRPDITIIYFDIIIKFFRGKIIYFAHDLHHIRLFREYNITHDKKKLQEGEHFEIIENKIFSRSDIIYVVGNYEFNIVKEKYNNKAIRNIPLFFYDKTLTKIEKDFSKRKDLIFVGNFLHSPNVDAILWFSKEIYPKIVERFPDIIWHIVGAINNELIAKINSNNIIFEGRLSDEDLNSLYQKCRISIAPLRYGAGIKGKLIEAAYNQIPMITTSIGGEGLDNSTGAFIIEDDAKKMSEIISNLYINFSRLKQMSDSGKIFIEKYFSKKAAKKILSRDFL
jgi:GT2 family glycosyltransferase